MQPATPSQLVLLPTGAGEQRTLPRGPITDYLAATWFPDNRRILIAAEAARIPRSYIQDVQGGTPRQIAGDGILAMLVSPDGKRLAAQGPTRELYLCSSEGQDLIPARGSLAGDELLQWSADGRFLYLRGPGDLTVQIFRLDLRTGERELWKELAPADSVGNIGIAADPRGIRLTPDGKSYAYTQWKLLDELFLVEGLR